jgi:hypothetical protein
MLVYWSYVYCYILWIIAFLYIIFPLPFSPLSSLIIASIYTIISQVFFHKYVHLTKKILVITIEVLMILMVALKSGELNPLINNNKISINANIITKIWTNIKLSLLINVLMFGIYLIYLGVNGETFIKVYFDELPQSHDNPNETVWMYLKRRFIT